MADTRLRVALTRQSKDNAPLAMALEQQGLLPLDWPALEIHYPKLEGLKWKTTLKACAGIAIVSPNAAVAFSKLVAPSEVESATLFSQGPGTSRTLKTLGFTNYKEATSPTSAGLAATLIQFTQTKDRVLIVCGNQTRSELSDRLEDSGRFPMLCLGYQNDPPKGLQRAEQPLSAIVFCSPSAAKRTLRANPWLINVPSVAIGPLTAAFLRDTAQVKTVVMAAEPTLDSLLEAILSITSKENS